MAAGELLDIGVSVDAVLLHQRDGETVEVKPGRRVNTWTSSLRAMINVDPSGVIGDMHYNGYRTQGPNDPIEVKGESVINNRGICIADYDDMRKIAEDMELPIEEMVANTPDSEIELIMASFLAVNVLVRRHESGAGFDHYMDPSVKLHVLRRSVDIPGSNSCVDAQIWVNEFTTPCFKPATNLHRFLVSVGLAVESDKVALIKRFKEASEGTRGWVGMAIKSGRVAVGDEVRVEPPNNPHAK